MHMLARGTWLRVADVVAVGFLAISCGRDPLLGRDSATRNELMGCVTEGHALSLPFDPTAGCRDATTAECSQCCRPALDSYGAEACRVSRPSTSPVLSGPCSVDCPACAPCSTFLENELLEMAKNARPSCDCSSIGSEVSLLCGDTSDCRCFCAILASSLAACPQLGEAVCGQGNRCGAVLATAPGLYSAGDEVRADWINFDTRTVFLGFCGSLAIDGFPGGANATVMPASPCSAPACGVALAPGQSWPVRLTIPSRATGGHFFLHGTYYRNCSSTDAIGPATCGSGPIDVYQSIDIKP